MPGRRFSGTPGQVTSASSATRSSARPFCAKEGSFGRNTSHSKSRASHRAPSPPISAQLSAIPSCRCCASAAGTGRGPPSASASRALSSICGCRSMGSRSRPTRKYPAGIAIIVTGQPHTCCERLTSRCASRLSSCGESFTGQLWCALSVCLCTSTSRPFASRSKTCRSLTYESAPLLRTVVTLR